jgi:hypothetical protein
MNTNFLRKVFERMHDRSLASAIAAAGADTAGQVSERTVRNWLDKRTTPDPAVLEQLAVGSREKMLKTLAANAWPAEEREAIAEALHACSGFVSGFAISLQNGAGKYPAFIHLASQIDLLEQALDVQRARDNLHGWVQTFLEADWVQDEHLTHPDDGTDAETTRRLLREAKSWEDLILPMAVFVVNVQFQFLATLDLEFCAGYLSEWEATPVFAALLPRLHPRVAPFVGTAKTTRDLFHYPTRRLLDATACLRTLRQSPGRNWPRSMPSAHEMAAWLDLADRSKLASNLPKWRSGRTITAARFEDLWDACFSFLPEADRPATPVPMLFAVTVFTEMFVKGSREDRDLTFISPDPAFYQHWWELQHQKLSTGAQPLRFGTRKWMPGLT